MAAQRVACPQCGRVIPVHKTRFGDVVLNHHKMAELSRHPSPAHVAAEHDWKPNVNPYAAPLWEIDCPMSGQPLEE